MKLVRLLTIALICAAGSGCLRDQRFVSRQTYEAEHRALEDRVYQLEYDVAHLHWDANEPRYPAAYEVIEQRPARGRVADPEVRQPRSLKRSATPAEDDEMSDFQIEIERGQPAETRRQETKEPVVTTPASAAPGSAAPGSDAPGSDAPGSDAPGTPPSVLMKPSNAPSESLPSPTASPPALPGALPAPGEPNGAGTRDLSDSPEMLEIPPLPRKAAPSDPATGRQPARNSSAPTRQANRGLWRPTR